MWLRTKSRAQGDQWDRAIRSELYAVALRRQVDSEVHDHVTLEPESSAVSRAKAWPQPRSPKTQDRAIERLQWPQGAPFPKQLRPSDRREIAAHLRTATRLLTC